MQNTLNQLHNSPHFQTWLIDLFDSSFILLENKSASLYCVTSESLQRHGVVLILASQEVLHTFLIGSYIKAICKPFIITSDS